MSKDETETYRCRIAALELEVGILSRQLTDHVSDADGAWVINDAMHNKILDKLEQSLRWQTRVKIIVGTVATILGAILMFVYHYAPWIWDALPKHGHTH